MGRLVRNTAILFKIETTEGTDANPVGTTDAVLISNQSVNPVSAKNVRRDLVRPYLGGSEELLGTFFKEVSFDVEYQSSGALGTAPAWGKLLMACAVSETVTAGTRVEYLLVSSAMSSATIYYYDDGVVHKLVGARGDATLKLGVGDRPVISFKFQGRDGGDSAAALPAVTLSAWKTPRVMADANTGDVTLGGTYSAGAITGGTPYPSLGLELSLNNSVAFTDLLGGETIDITQREVQGKVTFDLTAAQEIAFLSNVKAATLQSLSLLHGVGAGYQMLLFCPSVQMINPKKDEKNGRRLLSYDLRINPNVGNDELRLVAI